MKGSPVRVRASAWRKALETGPFQFAGFERYAAARSDEHEPSIVIVLTSNAI